MTKTDLTNQRQVFVEEYVRSGDHLEAAKKAGYKDTHTLRSHGLLKCLKKWCLSLASGFVNWAKQSHYRLTVFGRPLIFFWP